MDPQRLLVTLALSLPAIAGLTACGSSDSTSPKSRPAVDTVLADIDNLGVLEDDTIMSSDTSIVFGEYTQGTRQFVGWSYFNNGSETTKQTLRPVITYDLPMLAGRGVVDSAKAYVYQCGTIGFNSSGNLNPYSIGHLTIDHVNMGRVIESNASTYMGDTLQANIGTLSSDSTSGPKSIAVTGDVQADYSAKRSVSQYRLQWAFATPPTISGDDGYYAYLGSDCGYNNGGPGPWLVIWSH